MSQRSRILAEIDTNLVKSLKKRLIDDDLTYREWLDQRIREYLADKPQQEGTKQ